MFGLRGDRFGLWVALLLAGCGDETAAGLDAEVAEPDGEVTDAADAREDVTDADTDTDTEVGPRDPNATLTTLTALGARACDLDGSFLCGSLDLPLDHQAPEGARFRWAFAVRPADVSPPRGLLVTIVGGPGDSGLESLDDYAYLDDRFPREFDMAYFDLRGVGESNGLYCPRALASYLDGDFRVNTAATEAALLTRADALGPACLAEMGITPATAALYNTAQAADDLESLRATLAHPRLTIYGLSYGTQLGQAYAFKYPENVAGLVIDGVVDMTSSLEDYGTSLGESSDDLLKQTLDACALDAWCRSSLGDARRAWDRAVAQLPVRINYEYDGVAYARTMTRSDLDSGVFAYLGEASDRGQILEALVAIEARRDWEPMQELYFAATGFDPETDAVSVDPTASTYFLVTCADYGRVDREAYLAAGRRLWRQDLTSGFYGDVPCLGWGEGERRMPSVVDLEVPTLLVNATGDNATPYRQGVAVAERMTRAGVIDVTGGNHVMYGIGNGCVDDAVNAFLLDGTLPASRPLACPDVFLAPLPLE